MAVKKYRYGPGRSADAVVDVTGDLDVAWTVGEHMGREGRLGLSPRAGPSPSLAALRRLINGGRG
jgi:hypothetical protein